jgi:hypothetical protein
MKNVLLFLYNLVASMNPVVKVTLAAFTILLSFSTYMDALWTDVFTKIGTLTAGTFGNLDFGSLTAINAVVPLDTFCTLATAYCALLVICTGIRIVKSWIPTVA